jgi:hypothetical protein
VWCPPQGNIELMPEKEILDFKLAPRFEQVGKPSNKLRQCKRNGTFTAGSEVPILPIDLVAPVYPPAVRPDCC